jgi:hypothetical protein
MTGVHSIPNNNYLHHHLILKVRLRITRRTIINPNSLPKKHGLFYEQRRQMAETPGLSQYPRHLSCAGISKLGFANKRDQ